MTDNDTITQIKQRLLELDEERAILLSSLQRLEQKNVTTRSSQEKITIFQSLFRGRSDVYPKRWENQNSGRTGYSPACRNEWIRGICNKPKIKCTDCKHQAFIPVTEEVLRFHLTGRNPDDKKQPYTIGVYPLLMDETCWFLVADFDKDQWQQEVAAFLQTCKEKNVPAYLERSRSGNGGHVWIFFNEPIPAVDARKLGAYLLTETMEHYPDIGFTAYDRFFPNQDTLPAGGFGNLIALPLQYHPRRHGNSVFLDEEFKPYHDQWEFLASVLRMLPDEVSVIINDAVSRGRVTGVRMPLDDEHAKTPWKSAPSRKPKPIELTESLPNSINIVYGNQLYIPKEGLPAKLINRLIRLAAFQNPEFYRSQAMRLSTFDKPRIIACAEMFPEHIGLPRGCLDEVIELLGSLHVKIELTDKRNNGQRLKTKFLGDLNKEQKPAVNALLQHDAGVLSVATGFGKTVIAANIIAKRKRNTLILVHRKQLLDQWVARLQTFLDLDSITVGQIGGGKRKPSGQVDIALIQSLVRKGEVDDCVADYGQLIVDECHHLSAVSFEAVARQCKARYVLGLTATPVRKDGQQAIVFMQCGPIRYHVDAKKQAEQRPFNHHVISRYTEFGLSKMLIKQYERPPIQAIYAELAVNEQRNQMILNDVMSTLKEKRSPVILTERKEHVEYFAKRLQGIAKHIITLQGGMGKKAYQAMLKKLDSIDDDEERILIATGRFLGEGFDDARLDTLFLVMPVSWKGTLAQYAGRLHRVYHNKAEVRIYDYVDYQVPVLNRMHNKRILGYKSLGYVRLE